MMTFQNSFDSFRHFPVFPQFFGLKRGVNKALKEEKKATKNKKGVMVKDSARTFTEAVGNGEVSLKGQLTPGGTLQVKNLTEVEDDFLDYLSEGSDC